MASVGQSREPHLILTQLDQGLGKQNIWSRGAVSWPPLLVGGAKKVGTRAAGHALSQECTLMLRTALSNGQRGKSLQGLVTPEESRWLW